LEFNDPFALVLSPVGTFQQFELEREQNYLKNSQKKKSWLNSVSHH